MLPAGCEVLNGDRTALKTSGWSEAPGELLHTLLLRWPEMTVGSSTRADVLEWPVKHGDAPPLGHMAAVLR